MSEKDRLTRTQRDLMTLQTGWQLFLPNLPFPSTRDFCNWLYAISVIEILSVFERAAAFHANRNWVRREIYRLGRARARQEAQYAAAEQAV